MLNSVLNTKQLLNTEQEYIEEELHYAMLNLNQQ